MWVGWVGLQPLANPIGPNWHYRKPFPPKKIDKPTHLNHLKFLRRVGLDMFYEFGLFSFFLIPKVIISDK
jgi:hypothetical protein